VFRQPHCLEFPHQLPNPMAMRRVLVDVAVAAGVGVGVAKRKQQK
jgi:hypothetical protein